MNDNIIIMNIIKVLLIIPFYLLLLFFTLHGRYALLVNKHTDGADRHFLLQAYHSPYNLMESLRRYSAYS